ncbi:MAG: hypothetical protein Q4F80_03605 [bacterium]|nr:hypothetical protein [bacterium]
MGCLKKTVKMIVFIAIVFAFFAYGGYTFVKNKYDAYTKPERAVFVEEEKDYGDLSGISPDYALSRSLNLFGYRKLNAYYLPKKQRITIIDLNSNEILTEKDFQKGIIEEKLENFSSKLVNSPMVPVDNIEITNIGKIKAGSKTVSYADFEANIKMVPFFKAKGTVAIYETKNKDTAVTKIKEKVQNKENTTSKLVISCKFPNGYEDKITKKFISQIKL